MSKSWVQHTWLSQEVATSMFAVGLKHMLDMLSSGGDVTSISLFGLKFGWVAWAPKPVPKAAIAVRSGPEVTLSAH